MALDEAKGEEPQPILALSSHTLLGFNLRAIGYSPVCNIQK